MDMLREDPGKNDRTLIRETCDYIGNREIYDQFLVNCYLECRAFIFWNSQDASSIKGYFYFTRKLQFLNCSFIFSGKMKGTSQVFRNLKGHH